MEIRFDTSNQYQSLGYIKVCNFADYQDRHIYIYIYIYIMRLKLLHKENAAQNG